MSVQSAVPAWLQIVWALAGIGVAVGGFLWIVFVFYPYLKWTKRMMQASFDLGVKTTGHLDKLQADLAPVIGDLRAAVSDAREIVKELREKELEKIVKALDKLSSNGSLDETLKAIQSLPGKLDELLKAGKKGILKSL